MTKQDIKENLENYRDFLTHSELSPHTVEKYIRDLHKLLDFGNEQVDKDFLIAYKKHLSVSYSPTTVNSYLISSNKYFRWLQRNDLTLKTVHLPPKNSLENVLTVEEYQRMLAYAEDSGKDKNALIMRTLACTGIRVSELRFITWETVNDSCATIFSKGRYRRLLLPDNLKGALLLYCQRNAINTGIIFYGRERDQPLDSSGIWRMLKRMAAHAHVDTKKVYPHSFRHLFAKTYMEKVGNITELADLLGHASIETTRIYTLTSEQEKRRSLNMLDL